jgi:hypothetical protein
MTDTDAKNQGGNQTCSQNVQKFHKDVSEEFTEKSVEECGISNYLLQFADIGEVMVTDETGRRNFMMNKNVFARDRGWGVAGQSSCE